MKARISEEAQQPSQRRTLSSIFFAFIASHLQKTDSGKRIVGHILRRIGFYSQAWSITLTVALVILLRSTVVTAFYIPSESMRDTLKINDRLFVFRLAYLFNEPKIGDIVVFNASEDIPGYRPEAPVWIKRVVGVAGDRVAIVNNHLVVNGKKVIDPPFFQGNQYYSHLRNSQAFQETVVPEGHVLVFGDNSFDSNDGRYWGPLAEDQIIGKAFVRFWPLSRLGLIHGESVAPVTGLN